jgi:hypothetical protein
VVFVHLHGIIRRASWGCPDGEAALFHPRRNALRGSASLRGAMARRRWLAPLLVLCGVVGAHDASAEIGFDFVMATVVGATLVQALDFVSSQSTQLAYASRNGLLFNGTVAETTTMKTLMATAQNLGARRRGTRARRARLRKLARFPRVLR